MSLGRYALGVGLTAAVIASLALAATRLRGRLLPRWSGAPARLAEAVLGLSLLTGLSEGLGTFGLFRTFPLVAGCVIAGGASRRLGPGESRRGSEMPQGGPRPATAQSSRAAARSAAPVAVAALAVAVLAAQWTSRTAAAFGHGMPNMDTLWYHMPFAARFAQTGWVSRLHITHQEPLTSFFPANSELLHAVTILPFHRDLLSPILNLGWLAVALTAGWCIGRPVGRGGRLGAAPLTLTAVAAVLAVPILASTQPGDATNDVMALACLLASVAVLLAGDRQPWELVVAGLAAGLALGTKMSLVAPVGALTVGVLAIGARGRRRRVLVSWGPALAVTGGFWYLRNLLRAGSPVPTLRLGVGGLVLPRVELSVTGRTNFSVAHYLGDHRVWDQSFRPALRISLGEAWPLLLGLAALGVALALVYGPQAIDRALGAVALAAAIAYVVTPQTAAGPPGHPTLFAFNLRFLTPAVALGLVLLGRTRLLHRPPARAGLVAAFAVVIVAAETRSRYAWPAGYWPAALAAAAGVVACALTIPALTLRPPSLRLFVAGAVGVAVVVVGAGWPVQRHYLGRRYLHSEQVAAGAYEWARGVRRSRIAIAGFVQQYPLYGTDLSNWVQYAGQPLPRGGFRPAATMGEWCGALRRGRYRYVVLMPDGAPGEARWTAADAAATELLRAGPVRIYQLDRRLDRACGATQ